MNEKQKEFVKRLYDETGLDIAYDMDNVGIPADTDEFMELLEERVREEEVIYYHKAMEYLAEHDPSLQFSLEMAKDFGCELENINSELLATLHTQDRLMSEIQEYRDEIEELFYCEACNDNPFKDGLCHEHYAESIQEDGQNE